MNFSISTVHPHIRGAYSYGGGWQESRDGSSPHTWGIPHQGDMHLIIKRFIPTYVGHTGRKADCDLRKAVHPHIRGAYVYYLFHGAGAVRFIPTYVGHTVASLLVASVLSGSSPHTWGILVEIDGNQAEQLVHPHIRGAYTKTLARIKPRPGSSPHTWGIQHITRLEYLRHRFIPTYVGHTTSPTQGASLIAVHPHIRGAY